MAGNSITGQLLCVTGNVESATPGTPVSCFILLEAGKWADTVGSELTELMSKQFLTAKSNSKSKEEKKTRNTALVPLPI